MDAMIAHLQLLGYMEFGSTEYQERLFVGARGSDGLADPFLCCSMDTDTLRKKGFELRQGPISSTWFAV